MEHSEPGSEPEPELEPEPEPEPEPEQMHARSSHAAFWKGRTVSSRRS